MQRMGDERSMYRATTCGNVAEGWGTNGEARKRAVAEGASIQNESVGAAGPIGARPGLSATWKGPLLLAVAYFLGAEAAFYIGTLSDQIFALFWPPNVILFCTLLIVPQRCWWRFIAAAFPAHAVAEHLVGMPLPQLLLAFATNCMVALINAYAVRRFVGEKPWFGTFDKASRYVLIAVGIGPALSAFGGAFVPILGGGAMADYARYWAHWYLANALPNLTLGPVFL